MPESLAHSEYQVYRRAGAVSGHSYMASEITEHRHGLGGGPNRRYRLRSV